MTGPPVPDPAAGLCSLCVHARVVASARGSRFWLCELAKTDTRFRRYPSLPVLRCDGFRPGTDERPSV